MAPSRGHSYSKCGRVGQSDRIDLKYLALSVTICHVEDRKSSGRRPARPGHLRGWDVDVAALVRIVEDRGYTQMDLSRLSGLSYSHVRKVLSGDRNLSLPRARKLAEALGCDMDDFCHRRKPPNGAAA